VNKLEEDFFVTFIKAYRHLKVNMTLLQALLVSLSEECLGLLPFGLLNPVVILLIVDFKELVLDKVPE